MSTTTIMILNVFLIGGIVLTITDMLFHAIRTSPATERIHRRPRAGARRRPPADVRPAGELVGELAS